jgi:CheY-like chemotaxis protein
MVAGPVKPYQLLIADDDAGFRRALRQIFEPYLELLEADSGEEAIRIVEGERVDIVLLDMHMHELTGLETLRIVKSMRSIVPCILVTADFTEELRRTATEADAYSVLAKPIRRSELVTTVSTALEDAYSDSDALGRLGI